MKQILFITLILMIQNILCTTDRYKQQNFNAPHIVEINLKENPSDPEYLNKQIYKLGNERKKPNKCLTFLGFIQVALALTIGAVNGIESSPEILIPAGLFLSGAYTLIKGYKNLPAQNKLDDIIREKAFLKAKQDVEQIQSI